jgi:hypothetical protein
MGEAVLEPPLVLPLVVEAESMEEEEAPLRGFWRLPPEIRNAIYEELLVTDCAFRLGYAAFLHSPSGVSRLIIRNYRHHGPYSHERHKTLHPAILRTCSQAYHEAVAILYGSNTFFLGTHSATLLLTPAHTNSPPTPGPVGFKPTYSASFLTSIGSHNALRSRTIVAHCIHPQLLTKAYLSTWFSNLGLDFPLLKIIAVSFSLPGNDQKPRIISIPPPPMQFHIPTNLPVLGSHWPGTPVPAGSGHGHAQTHTHAQAQHGHVRVDSLRDEVEPESEFERAVGRTKGWLEKRKRSEVEGLVALRNTDLRAGDEWLVYVSPAMKKRMGTKIW